MNKALLILVAGAMFLIGAGAIYLGMNYRRQPLEMRVLASQPVKHTSSAYRKHDPDNGPLKEFTLTERSGKEVGTKDWKGKVWAASFFFSACPGECHRQNQAIAQIQQEFGKKGVTFVSISVDPDRDTPARLREYAQRYTKSADEWLFLTGDMDYIQAIGKDFFTVGVGKGTHGSRLMLVDKWGTVREWLSTDPAQFPQEYAKIRPALDQLLSETEPPKTTPESPASNR
jgi:cytochrome oxidase Cu insertion factor (SCO1/SenC/PrrC family)